MKILVLGGTGMAGHVIAMYFNKAGHDTTVLSRRKIEYCKHISEDITNFENLKKIIEDGQFDAIINAVGILNQDAEINKASAILVNSYLPHFLSDSTQHLKTKIVHMSTDCVFSGKKGGYSEYSFKDGESFYDRSKALGEIDNEKDITFRNSIIGPDINENGIGLFNWFMKQDDDIKGFTKVIWTGVTTLTLAKAMEQAVKENLTGLYNLVNNDRISKYDLLTLLNKHMKSNSINILPYEGINSDKSLINNRKDFTFIVPCYEQMIIEMKEWIIEHREIYRHYRVL